MQSGDHIPRYSQPMDVEPEGPTCGGCVYYRDVHSKQESDGSTHWFGVCIYEVFHAEDFDELAKAEVNVVDPDLEACVDSRMVDGC